MIKNLFNAIFNKKTAQTIEPSVPVFKITENAPTKADFEVTELSYEEYTKFLSNERRRASHPVVYDRRNPTGISHA